MFTFILIKRMSLRSDVIINSLELIGGRNCTGSATRPDLIVQGGMLVKQDVCFNGNVNVNGGSVLTTSDIVAGNGIVSVVDGTVITLSTNLEAGNNVALFTQPDGTIEISATGGAPCDPLQFVYYVAMNGDDATGTGSACAPYLTIQRGIDEAYAMSSMMSPTLTRPVVWVMPGTYNENPVLKANVLVRGLGYNDSRVMGNWTIDSTFTTPPSNDSRSGWADIGIFGTITADFNAVNSNEGKLFIYGCRLAGAINVTAFSSINQCLIYGGELFASFTQTGMVVQFNSVTFQGNPTITMNWSAAGGNTLVQSGGSRGNLVLNGVSGPVTAVLSGNVNSGASLTINGVNAQVISGASALPLVGLITFGGGATASQITRINDAFGLAYTPLVLGDWSGVAPTSVANALDRIAAQISPIL